MVLAILYRYVGTSLTQDHFRKFPGFKPKVVLMHVMVMKVGLWNCIGSRKVGLPLVRVAREVMIGLQVEVKMNVQSQVDTKVGSGCK